MKTQLGGNRLGSGGKRELYFHDFNYTTFNLNKNFKSSMAAGVLTPCYYNIALAGDIFNIDLNECIIRTEPTTGALFDSFKFQVDFFAVPIRLYNSIIHGNPINMVKKAEKIMFPDVILETKATNPDILAGNINVSQLSASSLLAYTGIRGLGIPYYRNEENEKKVAKSVQAMYILSYYDIFKNYYANTQEKEAYVIAGSEQTEPLQFTNATFALNTSAPQVFTPATITQSDNDGRSKIESPSANGIFSGSWNALFGLTFDGNAEISIDSFVLNIRKIDGTNEDVRLRDYLIDWSKSTNQVIFELDIQNLQVNQQFIGIHAIEWDTVYTAANQPPKLTAFALENIDEMRMEIFKNSELDVPYTINNYNKYPYKAVWEKDANGVIKSKQKLVGLVTKTYQADIFNNWLNIEEIDHINQATKISTSDGDFSVEALNFAYKMYQTMMRVQTAGSTYEDWQQAIWGIEGVRRAETPIFIGGYQNEIAFDEVLSNADAEVNGELQPLGTIATRGSQQQSKGGRIKFKAAEACVIMGIASITPRVNYSQGNHFTLELRSLDDLHKPTLDRIGFEDLILERAAWFARCENERLLYGELSGGKIPAYSHYQTEVNETFGDFAAGESLDFMCLNRNYEIANNFERGKPILDWTTYIDPSKFNGIWANARIDAQNFWVMLHMDIEARRKMSANPIPNL